jgi:hypothetical protein
LQKKKHIEKRNFNWEVVSAICNILLALGVSIALWQVYVSKKVATFDFLTKLDEEFNSQRIEKARGIAVMLDYTIPDANEFYKCEPVLDFFDKMAYLEEKGVIPLDAVDEYWGYWIERYWVLCEKPVYDWRKETPGDGYYEGFETLFNKLAKLSCKKSNLTNKEMEAYKDKIRNELDEFKKEETDYCNLGTSTPQLSGRINISLNGKH